MLFRSQSVFLGTRCRIYKTWRTRCITYFFCSKCCELQVSCIFTWYVADCLELRFDLRTDPSITKKFSTNPAFANTAFLPFWLVYRPWNVSGGIVSRNELFFTAYYGIAWNYHPWFRNFSFCYRQCNHEFR